MTTIQEGKEDEETGSVYQKRPQQMNMDPDPKMDVIGEGDEADHEGDESIP